MHSGWGVLVAISGDIASIEVVERRRIVTTDPEIRGANQPYHHAATLQTSESEKHLANCAAFSERLATAAITDLLRKLEERDYRIAACAVLVASGRPLPPLAKILISHPLIHTAEGEFFRTAVQKACENLNIPVTRIKERELEQCAKTTFGSMAGGVQRRISTLGAAIGPPWTKDQKAAALAAAITLAAN
jgi:hypothetical protein